MKALQLAALALVAGFAQSAPAATLDGKDIDDSDAICVVDDAPEPSAPCWFTGDQVEIAFEDSTVTAKLHDPRMLTDTSVYATDLKTGKKIVFVVIGS